MEESLSNMEPKSLGRRAFLKVAAVASLAPILAACGGTASVASSSGSVQAAASVQTSAAAKPASAAASTSAAASAKPAASGAAAAKPAASGSASAKPAASSATAARNLSGSLTMLQWSHFVPAYDKWFDQWADDWGKKNNVQVKVDHIALADLPARSAAEVAAKSGHDIFGWFAEGGPRLFDQSLVDVSDIVDPLAKAGGGYIPAAESLCKVNGVWKGVPDFFVPFLSLMRKDVMDKVGWTKGTLETWDDLLEFGTKSKAAGFPIGTALSDTSDGQMTWRSLMWSYGSYLTDKDGKKVTLDSPETRTVLDYAKKLYTQAMTPEVLSWDDSGNNRYLASGKGAWIYNPISALRSIEDDKAPQSQEIAKNSIIGQSLKGPKGQLMSPQWVIYGVWNWSKNVPAAKAFLTDLKMNWKEAFTQSKGYDMPFELDYNKAPMPVLSDDPKYKVIVGIEKAVQVIGYPGPNTVAANEALNQNVISTMFTDYAARNVSADQAIAKAVKAAEQIYAKAG
jgi:multiple sugar transport system substrate-binding protein